MFDKDQPSTIEHLTNIISVKNPEVANYGDGNHHEKIETKIKVWGPRESAFRCALVEDNIGFYNTGFSRIKTENFGEPHESGLLVNLQDLDADGSANVVEKISAAIVAQRCYMADLYRLIPTEFNSKFGIYTVSPNNPTTISILETSGYQQAELDSELVTELVNSSQRFSLNEGKLLEGQSKAEKLLFFIDYSYMPENMDILGEDAFKSASLCDSKDSDGGLSA